MRHARAARTLARRAHVPTHHRPGGLDRPRRGPRHRRRRRRREAVVTSFLRDEGFAVTVTEDDDGYRIDDQRGA
jgi:hypothetical protein